MSKRAASRYRSGPSKAWIKTKNVVESEFVLLGLERDTEGRPFAHVGREGSNGFRYAGMAFMTFGEKIHGELSQKAEARCMPACAVKGLKRPRATWLRPEIRVRVRHLRNGSGLRHASVRAILSRDWPAACPHAMVLEPPGCSPAVSFAPCLDFTPSEVCLHPPPAPHPFEPFLSAPKALVEEVQQRLGPIRPHTPIEVRLSRFEEVQR